MIHLLKAKFHYTSWFEAGSKLVGDQLRSWCLALRLRVNTTRPWMISSIWCYHNRGLEYCSSGDIDVRQQAVGLHDCRTQASIAAAAAAAAGWIAAWWPIGLYAAALLLRYS